MICPGTSPGVSVRPEKSRDARDFSLVARTCEGGAPLIYFTITAWMFDEAKEVARYLLEHHDATNNPEVMWPQMIAFKLGEASPLRQAALLPVEHRDTCTPF